jgi:hypothetical protein
VSEESEKSRSQYGTQQSEAVQREALFAHARATEIHMLYRERSRPDPTAEFYDLFGGGRISERAERILVDRNDSLIDTALALWGENDDTCRRIYLRWFSEEASWPPQENTAAHRVLHSLLSNRFHPLTQLLRNRRPDDYFQRETIRLKEGGPQEENPKLLSDERLAAALSVNDSAYLAALGLNPACLSDELSRFPQPGSVYQALSPLAQARCLKYFSENERFRRLRSDGYEGPDFDHNETHRSFLNAIAALSKEDIGAAVLCSALEALPRSATHGAWLNDEAAGAVAAWSFDLPIENDSNKRHWEWQRVGDDLTPTERIRFHIWRHYPDEDSFSPNDPDKVRRMAFYATAKMKKRSIGSERKQVMKYDDITRYALRDGANFKYAASYNPHIWADDSEDGQSFASAIRNILPPSDDSRADRISGIVARTIDDEERRLIRDRERRRRNFNDDQPHQDKDPSASQKNGLLEKINERLIGYERFLIVIFLIWLAGQIWKEF